MTRNAEKFRQNLDRIHGTILAAPRPDSEDYGRILAELWQDLGPRTPECERSPVTELSGLKRKIKKLTESRLGRRKRRREIDRVLAGTMIRGKRRKDKEIEEKTEKE